MQPPVSIVIVTWNKRGDVLNLLDSLQHVCADSARIIVVDNASTDGSAEAVRRHPLAVTLLENRENLGGTGGFNSGIRYALGLPGQQYVWLLDNDAQVTTATLPKMVATLAGDATIGVAGSCILSPEDPSLIIEAGGFVDGSSGTWKPNRRYQRYEPVMGRGIVEAVDYVPACSALVRVSVLREIGILDERFFLHWDDIDFCARVREAGFRVVSVLDSPAFHGAEKGHSPITLYYDFRNALLFFSKHSGGGRLPRALFALLDNFLTSQIYLRLLGRRKVASYLLDAHRDFLSARFGRAATAPSALRQEGDAHPSPADSSLAGCKKVVVFAVGSYDEVTSAIRAVKAVSPGAAVSVAVARERAEAYRLPEVHDVVVFDLFRDRWASRVKTAVILIVTRFSYGVTAGSGFTVPYAFLLRRNLSFEGGELRSSAVAWTGLWKIAAALVAGKLWAILMLLPTWLAARRYRE